MFFPQKKKYLQDEFFLSYVLQILLEISVLNLKIEPSQHKKLSHLKLSKKKKHTQNNCIFLRNWKLSSECVVYAALSIMVNMFCRKDLKHLKCNHLLVPSMQLSCPTLLYLIQINVSCQILLDFFLVTN